MRDETRHSIVLLIGSCLTAGTSIVYVVLAGRIMGVERYSDFTAALAMVTLCVIGLGPINGTLTRFTAQYAGRGELGKIKSLAWEVSRRVTGYGLIGLVLGLVFCPLLADKCNFSSVGPCVLVVIMVYLNLPLSVFRGVLRGSKRFLGLSINTVFESLVRLAIGVGLLYVIQATATVGLAAYVLALAAVLVFSWFQMQPIWAGHPREQLDGSAVKRFAFPLFLMMLTVAGFGNIDMLFVKYAFSPLEAGWYGAAFSLSRTVHVLATPFTTMILPVLSGLHDQGKGVGRPFLRITVYFLLLCAGPLLLFGLVPDLIILHVYEEEFAPAAPLLLPITALRLIGLMCHLVALAFAATDRFRFLWVFVPCLLIQPLVMSAFGETLLDVAVALLVTQAASAVVMLIIFIISSRRSAGIPSGSP